MLPPLQACDPVLHAFECMDAGLVAGAFLLGLLFKFELLDFFLGNSNPVQNSLGRDASMVMGGIVAKLPHMFQVLLLG